MPFLLDTNVVSEIFRRRPDARVVAWWERAPGPFFLSVLVLGELRRGVENFAPRAPARAAALGERLEQIRRTYAASTLPVTEQITREWGRLSATRPLPDVDGLLAATAVVHGLTVATRNLRHFSGLDVAVVNPFD